MSVYLYVRAGLGSVLDGLRQRLSQEERGAESIEWLGIAAVAAAVVGAILVAVGESTLGETVVTAIENLIAQVVGGGAEA